MENKSHLYLNLKALLLLVFAGMCTAKLFLQSHDALSVLVCLMWPLYMISLLPPGAAVIASSTEVQITLEIHIYSHFYTVTLAVL